jgi:hypothetical protein
MGMAMENVRYIKQRQAPAQDVEQLRAMDKELIRLQADEIGRLKAENERLKSMMDDISIKKIAAKH